MSKSAGKHSIVHAVAAASTVDNAIQRAALIFCGDKTPSLKREGGSRFEEEEGMKGSGRCLSDVAAAVCGLLFMEATDSISEGGDNRFCTCDMDVVKLDLTRKFFFEANALTKAPRLIR